MREDVHRCPASGMNGHVPKPLDQSRLIAAVQTALCGGEAFPVAQAA
jgi:DNA-binding NarL/FixJ family response regulator